MAERNEILELLRFELKFLEDGGYGRSPRTPWRPSFIFEDSPTCLNFGDPSRTIPCSECILMQFVPVGQRAQRVPCRHIPLTENGDTIEHLYRHSTQAELEDALKNWLRKEITRIEAQCVASVQSAEAS